MELISLFASDFKVGLEIDDRQYLDITIINTSCLLSILTLLIMELISLFAADFKVSLDINNSKSPQSYPQY